MLCYNKFGLLYQDKNELRKAKAFLKHATKLYNDIDQKMTHLKIHETGGYIFYHERNTFDKGQGCTGRR